MLDKISFHPSAQLNIQKDFHRNSNIQKENSIFLGAVKGEEAKEFVKNGGCALALHQDLVRQEWRNQKHERAHYFHKFAYTNLYTYAGWSMLSTSPYKALFHLKFMHMEQAGIIARLSRQYSTFKSSEPEELEPLKLEHFYITMIGIVGGTILGAFSFAMEVMSKFSQKKLCIKKICF